MEQKKKNNKRKKTEWDQNQLRLIYINSKLKYYGFEKITINNDADLEKIYKLLYYGEIPDYLDNDTIIMYLN